MQLIRCHIENFGKLSDFSVELTPGINFICKENGWGKTTLTDFIKVMFYGFDNERGRKSEYENERKRYRPWQGGVYGGQLTFEHGGKCYVVSRTFGTKDKDDTFELRDADTNVISEDFSANIGIELFQINKESFRKTVLVSHNDCETKSTDDIHAKIGNLAEYTDDMKNYELVERRLSDALNAMSARRKTGTLYKLNERIQSLKEEVKAGAALDETIAQQRIYLQETKKEQQELEEKQSVLQQRQLQLARSKDAAATREQYHTLKTEYEQRKRQLEEAAAEFPEMIPELSELEKGIGECQRLAELKKACDIYRFSEEKARNWQILSHKFSEQVPGREELEEISEKIKIREQQEREFEKRRLTKEEEDRKKALEQQFAHGIPERQELQRLTETWNICAEKKNGLPARRRSLSAMQDMWRERERQRGTRKMLFLLLGLVLLATGIAMLFLLGWLGLIPAFAGLGCLLFSLIAGRQKKQIQEEAREKELQRLQQELEEDEAFVRAAVKEAEAFCAHYRIPYRESDFLRTLILLEQESSEYLELQKRQQLAEDFSESDRKKTKEELEDFFGDFGISGISNADGFREKLHELQRDAEQYELYKKEMENYHQNESEYKQLLECLRDRIAEIGFAPEDDLSRQYLGIRQLLNRYQICSREYETAAERLDDFCRAHDVDALFRDGAESEDASMEALAEELKALADRMDELKRHGTDYDRQIDISMEKHEAIAAQEEQLLRLQGEYEEGKIRYRYLEKTKEYLEKAKEAFTSRYMEPVMGAFRRYYRMLTGQTGDRFHIDANMNITVDELGRQREVEFFSTGYRDLIGLCLRMAFTDAMYGEEKPFLILDDPFVNLDEEKCKAGLRFIRELSKEYQVIYFASRDYEV